MENPQDYGLVAALPEVFDHSWTGPYLECNRMGYYQGILGRRLTRASEYNLMWGGVFHKLAELWTAAGGDLEKIVPEVMEVISLNIPEDVDDRYGRDRRKMMDVLIQWVSFRKSDPLEVLRPEQSVVVACKERCPFSESGCDLTYGGKMDEVVRWNAMVGPLDFKTTVRDESDPMTEYKPSHQMEGYAWMLSHLMGKRCWGVIVERIVANKSKIKIDRFPISFSTDQLREWAETERLTHAEIGANFAAHPYDEIYWKQNKGRCAQPYVCAFRDVCTSPREFNFRYRWLRDNTEERRFDFRKEKEKANA